MTGLTGRKSNADGCDNDERCDTAEPDHHLSRDSERDGVAEDTDITLFEKNGNEKTSHTETDENKIVDDDAAGKADGGKPDLKSHVSFGHVEVHKHRMTMGSNPSATGIPVELAWEEESSERIPVDEFQEHHDVHRIATKARRRIAEEHHSRASISIVENEATKIKKSIAKSKTDPVDMKESACCTVL